MTCTETGLLTGKSGSPAMSTNPPRTQDTGREPPRLPRARLEPGTLLGDWQIEGVIGIGGMGTVYSAVHRVIGKRSAIKVVRADACANPVTRERFVQEARVANSIGHPNIVDIFHIGTLDDDRPYLVMELLLGRTLGRRMADGRVSPDESIEILLQICDALGAAHTRGVVHRDLKPDNVFLCEGGGGPWGVTVKLVDWGIAKLMDAEPSGETLTTTGTLVGTPQYMSPEQARARPVDGRTDVYSLGTIAYEMFLEAPPFQADNIADLVTMHLREDPPPPSDVWPDIPTELEQLLLAMLAKTPEERPSVETIRETLRRVRDGIGERRLARANYMIAASPELIDHAPTWGMPGTPYHEAQDEPSWRPARHVSTPIGARAVTDDGVLAASPATGTPARRPTLARLAGIGSALLALAATGMVMIGGGDAGPIAPSARTAARVVRPHAPALEVSAVAAAAPVEIPQVAAAMPPIEPEMIAPSIGVGGAGGAASARIDVRVRPRTARVTVDGSRMRVHRGRVVTRVEPGELDLVVEAAGYAPYRRTLDIGSGTVMVDVRLEPRARSMPQHLPESRRAVLDVDPDGTIDPFP